MADTFEFEVETRTEEVQGLVRELAYDQIPFATSRAINATALEFQREQTAHMMAVFRVRNRVFIRYAVKIKPFATKRSLEAVVRIDPPGTNDDILTKFEEGGTRYPLRGRSLAIPREDLRTRSGRVRKTDLPKAYGFRKVSGPTARNEVFRGRLGTFLVRRPDGTGGIFKRETSGRRMASTVSTRKRRDVNVQTIFRFTPSARIDDRLQFVDIAQRVVAHGFDDHFTREFDRALKTAGRSFRRAGLFGRSSPGIRSAQRRLASLAA